MAGVLFEDIFDVKDIDPEGKKFDRGNEHLSFTFFIPMCSFFCVLALVEPTLEISMCLQTNLFPKPFLFPVLTAK